MDNNPPDTRSLGTACNIRGVQHIIIPAKSRFQRYGDINSVHHSLDQSQRVIRRFHQSRAGITVHNLFGRTAHVDVNHRGTLPLNHSRGFGHGSRLAARQLHGCANVAQAQFRPFATTTRCIYHVVACNHFGHDHTRPKGRDQIAKRQVSDSSQRGQHHWWV